MSTTPANPVSRPWRRFLRFSTRGMIVVVVVVGGWLGWLVRSARIQREAVAAIEKTGGSVLYDWEWRDEPDIPAGKLWAPRWLVDQVGIDYFGHVISVTLDSSSMASDSTLELVARFKRLRELGVARPSVTDAGVAHLEGLSDLSWLGLPNTQVTNAGLAHIRGLTKLKGLGLANTHVSDLGLKHLEGLTNLQVLELVRTQVTDRGATALKGALPRLTIINLD
jgi:internalin A